jgi:teichuronic acid biosynthesis glycosyltransferase TuaG
MKENLVSVIIPYYYKRNYLRKALQSVLLQSHKKLEIIIVYDNGSKNELDYVKKISILDPRIKLIINKKNIGAGRSRNKAIRISSGEYIAFLDADDYWKKNKLEYQINFMIRNKINFSFTSYYLIDDNNIIIKKIVAKKLLIYKNLIQSCDIGLSTVMLKKIILNKLKFPNLKTKEDYVLWLNISKKISLHGINKILSYWKKTPDSLSSSVYQKIKDAFLVYNNHMKYNVIKSILLTFFLCINFIRKRYL